MKPFKTALCVDIGGNLVLIIDNFNVPITGIYNENEFYSDILLVNILNNLN